MLQVLRSRRYVRFAVLVVVLVALFVSLGIWQLDRLHQRRANNALIRAHLDASPVAVSRLPVDAALPTRLSYLVVTATGRYDVAHQTLVRNHEGTAGYEVLTPLVTPAGPALLVDRGFVPPPAQGSASTLPDVPVPPSGQVTVTARLRQPEPAKPVAEGTPAGVVYSISPQRLRAELPYPLYAGYGELVEQVPPAGALPRILPAPEITDGPHLSYALQWFSFALIAVGGFFLLAWRDARRPKQPAARVSAPPAAGG